jgi:hypothetical protein
MCRSMNIPHIHHRPTGPTPTATGNGITGSGAGSQEFSAGGSLLESCRRDRCLRAKEKLKVVNNVQKDINGDCTKLHLGVLPIEGECE